MWLFLVFVAVPIVEIALFIEVGSWLGLWPTIAIVVLTALIGTVLVRVQGIRALKKLQKAIETGQNPVGPIAQGAMILAAGLLLLTPGFFTDTLGLALLVPKSRDLIIGWAASRFVVSSSTFRQAGPQPNTASEAIIDAEFEVVDEHEGSSNSSKWKRQS